MEEAVLGGSEHCSWVVGEGAIFLPDSGDGAVAGVGHGVVEVAYGCVGEFVACISLVFFGDALLSVDVPLRQVRPDVGYLRPAVVYVVAGLRDVGVQKGGKVLLPMSEGMEHIPQGRGWLAVLSLRLPGDGSRAHCCE